jgi:hypothetical protein
MHVSIATITATRSALSVCRDTLSSCLDLSSTGILSASLRGRIAVSVKEWSVVEELDAV